MKYINLTKGKKAMVDDWNYEWLSQFKWCLSSRRYAVRSVCLKDLSGRRTTKTIHMHRLILGTPDGKETDHINGDKLDNQISNLRIASRSENMFNQRARADSRSGVKGVWWLTRYKAWESQIKTNGKVTHLGRFKNISDAIDARNAATVKYHGDFARLSNHI